MQTLDFFEKFEANSREFANHVALQIITDDGRETFTYGRIAEEIRGISSFLRQSGLEPGQAVGILMQNHPRWGIAYLAAQSAGAIVVPFDILHSETTLAKLVQHAQCRFLITSEDVAEKTRLILDRLPETLPVLTTGTPQSGWSTWDSIVEDSPESDVPMPLVKRGLDDPLSIMYTSGTTGDPKGVVLSQGSLYRNVVAVLERIEVTSKDHILSVLPLYHALALMGNFIIPLYVGARVTYMPVLEAQKILQAFRDEGISIFLAVPQFYYLVRQRVLQEVERQSRLRRAVFRRLLAFSHFCNQRLRRNPGKIFFGKVHATFGPHLRLFAVGGARFAPEVGLFFRDIGFDLVQAYGMTETAAVATVTPLNRYSMGSVGSTLPHVEIRIQNPDEDGIGEVMIGGKSLMEGYWRNESATQEVLSDGWLNSGDLGYVDSEGMLFITGRRKEVIVLASGKNIFPEEVEHHYQSRDKFITEMSVIGVPDETAGEGQEKLYAVIVPDFDALRRAQVVNAADMIRYNLENNSADLPSYKRVHSFEIRKDPLPRTTTRKIKRHEVQDLVLRGKSNQQESQEDELVDVEPRTPTEARIFELIRQAKKVRALDPQMNLELDVGFDSLERVEFLSNVQDSFQVAISDDEATEVLTVGELVDAIERRLSGEITSEVSRLSWNEILREPLSSEDQRRLEEVLGPKPLSEFAVLIAARVIWLIGRIFFRLRYKNLERFPEGGGYLICPNHLSFLDAPLLVCGLPRRMLKRLFYLGFASYFSTGIMGWLGRVLKVVPVDPDKHLRLALRLGAEGLRQGGILCVFPEGERSFDGQVQTFRKGPSILAESLQANVTPVGIVGTYEVWPRASGKIRRHPVEIRVGETIAASGQDKAVDESAARLFDAVSALVDENEDSAS